MLLSDALKITDTGKETAEQQPVSAVTMGKPVQITPENIQNMIYTVRKQQVMFDFDLACIYGYEVRALNQQVKRNINRFPEDFMFQLTKNEVELVKSQIVTSRASDFFSGQSGGRRKPPYVFTEQGIYMLGTVLKGDVAERQTIFIMRAFKEMRRFVTNNSAMFERIKSVELRQLEYEKEANEKFDQIFACIGTQAEQPQKIFFSGQIFDAFIIIIHLIKQAVKEIILIDSYVDITNLEQFTKKQAGVRVNICTTKHGCKITDAELKAFNEQYPFVTVTYTDQFHDRFLILDRQYAYHFGASLKDAGKKCFGIFKIEEPEIINNLLTRISLAENKQMHCPNSEEFRYRYNEGISLMPKEDIMRKLATIQKIWKIEPIEGADRIELAHVLGWQCVVKKGQFRPMDLGVYFEIDSFLPIRSEFEFLRSSSYRKSDFLGEGYRLRTQKFRGQISQGLILPVTDFPELRNMELQEHLDVTDILGVRKWEVPEQVTGQGTIIGTLPPDIPKTDETRVQAEPELIREFHGLEYYISTKMDGSSHSCSIDEDGVFHVTGHNYEYKDDDKSDLYKMLKERNLEKKMRNLMKARGFTKLVIQGELCGEGIQKNRLRLKKPEWYVFTVRVDGKRVGLREMLDICNALELTTVPIEEIGMNLDEKYPTVESLLLRADGSYPNGGKKEGIVIRPTEPVYSNTISALLSMKVVNNKYLLKNE